MRQGGTLRPLGRLTHKELETLYHELFHAYMDFLEQERAPTEAHAFGDGVCSRSNNGAVSAGALTPVLQKKELKEERFLQ